MEDCTYSGVSLAENNLAAAEVECGRDSCRFARTENEVKLANSGDSKMGARDKNSREGTATVKAVDVVLERASNRLCTRWRARRLSRRVG